jgi:1,2-diacylglycerol 3-alpha-glucosyltransferase
VNIVIVTNNYAPYSGGVVSSINAFAQGLRELGHSVFIVTLDFTGEPSQDPFVLNIFCPVRFKYKKNHLAIPWRATNELKLIIKRLNPDVVHSQHPFLLGVSAVRVCKELKIPIVFTHHTQYVQYSHYIPLPGLVVKPVINHRVLWYAKLVDAIIAPSAVIKNELVHKGVENGVCVLPSPLLPVFFDSPQGIHSESRSFKLLIVSRFMKEKNIPFLLDMFARLPRGFTLTLVGYGALLPDLKEYAYDRLGLSKHKVRFVVKPPKARLLKLYRSADLFVFSSLTETQGLVVAEAMASGLPVVALDSPALHDIIQNKENGFLVSNIQEMVECVQSISQDPVFYSALKQGALNTAQGYSSCSLSKRLIEFYNKTIQSQG